MTASAPGLVRAFRPVFINLAFIFSPKIRRNTRLNATRLGVKSGDEKSFGLAVVGSFYDFVCDIGRSVGCSREQLVQRIDSIEGTDAYHQARNKKRGAILLTAHMGSFEVGLAALPIERRVHVVFKRDRIPGFEDLRRSLREQLNVAEAPIDDGLAGWMRLREALLNDEIVVVQGDRVMPGQKGVQIKVLGGSMMLPTGPFKLALAANAPVVPIFSIRLPDGKIRISISPAIDVAIDGIDAAIEQFAAILSKNLSAHPRQWLVLNAAFCEDAS